MILDPLLDLDLDRRLVDRDLDPDRDLDLRLIGDLETEFRRDVPV